MAATRKHSAGFSMLEVLLTIFIVTVGLLGLVGMQVLAQESEFESYQRAQALVLMGDIVDRVNSNRKGAECYAISAAAGKPFLGTDHADKYDVGGFACPAHPDQEARARLDLQIIDDLLLGASEKTATATVGAMVGARACIGFDATTQTYSVAVAWQGLSQSFSPASWPTAPAVAKNCAVNLYGNDSQRRVVWTTIMVANLSS